jgi:opacity protein-like surface antigen
MRRFATLAFVVSICLGAFAASSAEAQLSRGNLRLSIDADMFAIAGVEVGNSENKVISFGPNQLGGSRLYGGPTPLGLGVGYVLQPKLILGVRVGLGYDVIAPEGVGNNTRVLGLSIMPELRFVPLGERAKLYLAVAPIFQVGRSKRDHDRDRAMVGGFGLGVGTFIFVTNAMSVDLGFHFEGRFGGIDDDNDPEDTDVRDLRGVVRLGMSLWT